MQRLVHWLFLLLMTTAAFAADVRYNGIKPDFIIDVRTPDEFSAGHIEGAINIPVDRIGLDVRTIMGLKQDSRILLYCRSGRRSAVAAGVLQQQGYKHVLDGGGIEMLARSLKHCKSGSC